MQTDAGDASSTDRVLDHSKIILWSYVVGLGFLTATLSLLHGLIVAAAVAVGIHILLHLRLFEVTQTTTFVTSKPISSVVAEFSTARNPLTAAWIAAADDGTTTDEDDRSVESTLSGPLGIRSSHVSIEVTETADDECHLVIRRGEDVIITTTITFEAVQDGTQMIVTTHRASLHAVTLALLTAIGSEVQSTLADYGYDTIDTERSTGFRSVTES